MQRFDTACGVFGIVLVVAVGLFQVAQYGKRWNFDSHGFPQVMLDSSGTHYGDGTLVDPLTLHLMRSGHHRTFLLAGVILCVVCGLGTLYLNSKNAKLRVQLAEIHGKIARLQRS